MTNRHAGSMGSYGSTWESRGYCGSGPVGDLLESLRGRPAVIAGSAEGVFDELRVVLRLYEDPVIFAVNDIGMFLPKVDHWVSLHSDKLGMWKQVRWMQTHAREKTLYHSVDERHYIDVVWTGLTPLFALSGYFAMQLAWLMGASSIVLCGCPGTQRRRFFDLNVREFGYGANATGVDEGVRSQIEREMTRLPQFKEAVRSMSGWTKLYFGGV